MGDSTQLRWRTAQTEDVGALFSLESLVERHIGPGEYRELEFLHVNARSIINSVPPASKMGFRYTINVYRGCSHACTYCFARPTHAYLNLGIGEDFEHKIVVKINAVERLRAELRSPRWQHGHIAMGTNTDPYQVAEAKYHLTRGVITELVSAGNPFSILTKSTLVLRDIALLAQAHEQVQATVAFSIGTLDRDVWKLTEPGTAPPDKRIEAVARLNAAGVPCGVLIAPVLPGLSDGEAQLRAVARACRDAGATSISPIALHLRPGIREHFMSWLGQARPELSALYAERFRDHAYQDARQQQRLTNIVEEAIGTGPRQMRRLASSEPEGCDAPAPMSPDLEQLRLL